MNGHLYMERQTPLADNLKYIHFQLIQGDEEPCEYEDIVFSPIRDMCIEGSLIYHTEEKSTEIFETYYQNINRLDFCATYFHSNGFKDFIHLQGILVTKQAVNVIGFVAQRLNYKIDRKIKAYD